MLADQVLGNPHSVNPSSMETTRRVEQARAAVLDYFGGTGDYTAIFTLNAIFSFSIMLTTFLIGLTLGGITGRIVSELISGLPPSVDISALRSDRF